MPALAVIEPSATTEVLAVMVDELAMPRIVSVPALAVMDPTCDIMPATVSVPALAVMDPSATIDVLAVIVDELAIPRIVSVPALAVIDPT